MGLAERTAVAVGVRCKLYAADGVRIGAPHADARKAHRELCAPVQTVSECDELAASRVNGREQRSALRRFRARPAAEALLQVAGRDLGEFFGEVHEVLRQVDVADMLQCFDLLCDLLRNLGIAVAAVDDGNTREIVEILPALAVEEVLHGAAHDLARLTVEVAETGHDVLLLLFEDGFSTDVFFQIMTSLGERERNERWIHPRFFRSNPLTRGNGRCRDRKRADSFRRVRRARIHRKPFPRAKAHRAPRGTSS